MPNRRLFLGTALIGLAFGPQLARAQNCNLPAAMDDLRSQVIAAVNAERRANGLPALRADGKLDTAAQSLACDNAARQDVSHVSLNGAQLQGRLRTVGYRFRAGAENVQRGAGAPDQAVAWWMGSPGHRANILTQGLRDIGVGVAVSDAPDSRLHWVITMGSAR